MPQPLVAVAVSPPSGIVSGFSRNRTHRAAPTSSVGQGIRVASQQWPIWSQRKRNVGLHCKEGSQVLDASLSKLEIFLFSWSGIELFPLVGTRCLCML